MYHFCVHICIQLQHIPLSTRKWYKLRGRRIHCYKSPLCKALALKGGGGGTPGWVSLNFLVLILLLKVISYLHSLFGLRSGRKQVAMVT